MADFLRSKYHLVLFHWRNSTQITLDEPGGITRLANELPGMLCINVDISAYTQISELALKLGGIVPNHAEQASEIFVDGVSNSVNQVLTELYGENIPQHFSMDERTNILRILSDRKIFLIKGAVPRVARMLGCSEPTVYRGIKFCEAMN